MRLFADSNIARAAVLHLRASGHDVIWAGDRESDPGDPALLAEARGAGRVFITKDHDLGTIVFRDGAEHAGVLLIDELYAPEAEAAFIAAVLGSHGALLASGAFVRASVGDIRVAGSN